MRSEIVQNIIRCKKCQGFAESRSVHDYRSCPCGAVAADGGQDYLKRSGDAWVDYSLTREELSASLKKGKEPLVVPLDKTDSTV